MKPKFLHLTVVLFFLGCLASGCSAASIQAFTDIGPLSQKLVDKYQWQGIRVVLNNGTALGISFINSPFNQLPKDEQEAKAREIATYAKQNYGSIDQISQIFVAFVVYDKLYGVVDYTNALDTYFFDVEELGVPDLSTQLTNEFQTFYVFDPNKSSIPFSGDFFALAGGVIVICSIVMTLGGIWIARRRKENAFLILTILGVLGILFGALFVGLGVAIPNLIKQSNAKLITAYNQNQAQVVEGQVRVLHEQPREGHTDGDIIKIGDKQFEINYFAASPTYHRTIAYGGILREGVYARVYYIGSDIVRIDLKKP